MKLPHYLSTLKNRRRTITYGLAGIAALSVVYKISEYVRNPWTRDAQVRTHIVQVTPRVSGPIIKLPVKDNQVVQQGQLLFEIDPRTFREQLNQAKAKLDATKDDLDALTKQVDVAKANIKQAESEVELRKSSLRASRARLKNAQFNFQRASFLIQRGSITRKTFDDETTNLKVAEARVDEDRAGVLKAEKNLLQAEASLAEAIARRGETGERNAQLRAAKAAVRDAALNLEFTKVSAPVSGYITNMNLRLGSQTVANQPALALLDGNGYWIEAYFRESWVGRISPGDQAVVTLMSYPNQPISGTVESIGWGISMDNGSTGEFLLPKVNPTFEWIRLAQRIPVKVQLNKIPANVVLRMGTTASVLVQSKR